MDSDSDSSSLSSAPEEEVNKLAPIFLKAKKATKLAAPPPVVSSPKPKRPPSPPHEEVLADNSDIAVIVMFRSRFQDAFPGKLAHYGPQDIERGVVDTVPSAQVESLLCALLALVLNRKKPVERGHYGRALEEAVATHKSQWPQKWASQNPLHGGKDFSNMSPTERLNLLRTLVMWALSSSEIIQGIIKEKYKQNRHSEDENQPLSVQPWGTDVDKRRYFLIQGLDDSSFRVYREGSRYTKNAHWWSVAGTIDEVKALAEKLDKDDGSQAARRLSMKMINAIPMFEATEEKRHRREYRQSRRAAFSRPEPGYGIYEGRTRGKRMRYNYDDDDEFLSDDTSTRRSTRHQSARSTPFEAGPTFTASGRQIKQPRTGEYGESLLRNNVLNSTDELAPDYDNEHGHNHTGGDDSEPIHPGGRSTRFGYRPQTNGAGNPRKRKYVDEYNSIDDMSDEEEAGSPSGDEWNSEQNDGDGDDHMPDAGDEGSESPDQDEDDDLRGAMESLIVRLKVPKNALIASNDTPPTSPPSMMDEAPKTEINGESSGRSFNPSALIGDTTTSSTAKPAVEEPALPNGTNTTHTVVVPESKFQEPPATTNQPSTFSGTPNGFFGSANQETTFQKSRPFTNTQVDTVESVASVHGHRWPSITGVSSNTAQDLNSM